ncbi:MAG: hypothetical protein JWN25_3663 [Verrucomicrobiales bacterium]|nr:hypothetical protein [Verrucomicrobiales bacterium]
MNNQCTTILRKFGVGLTLIAATFGPLSQPASASSHMDAPLITLDPAANTTDVYAFVTRRDNVNYLTVSLSVYPFEEPGVGPNKYNFDDNVLYQFNISTTNKKAFITQNDVTAGAPTFSYRFLFHTAYKNRATILQSYTGVISNINDDAQNLVQSYTVQKYDHRLARFTTLGTGIVPPNNQGVATPFYNDGDNGENPARQGVDNDVNLDRYTKGGIASLARGYRAFAGQRDDSFFGDIQSIFDLLQLRGSLGAKDSQKGYNVHTIVLEIPLTELGSEKQIVGVFATTYRQQVSVLRDGFSYGLGNLLNGGSFGVGTSARADANSGRWVQIGRQGNPLFCEAFVAIQDKDLYNRTLPQQDSALFTKYAQNPELASLIKALVIPSLPEDLLADRSDLVGIFIPDMLKVDLSTGPVRLTGAYNDDPGFSSLSIFGGDLVNSPLQGKSIPSGWPNGRRFGDDVVDIGISAVISDLRKSPPDIRQAGDSVYSNDITYNKVFPYAATPHNGRNHAH